MKYIAILLALFITFVVVNATVDPILLKWQEFKNKYNKVYANGKEETRRFNIFKKNVHMIDEINRKKLDLYRWNQPLCWSYQLRIR